MAKDRKDTGKRELIDPNGDKRYVRRTSSGEFADNQDDVGRSLSKDVKQRAKNTVEPGHGDQGDQRGARKRR